MSLYSNGNTVIMIDKETETDGYRESDTDDYSVIQSEEEDPRSQQQKRQQRKVDKENMQRNVAKVEKNEEDESYDVLNSPIKKTIIKERNKVEDAIANVNEPDQDVEESYAEIEESNEIVSEIINKKVIKDPPIKTKKYTNKPIKKEDTIANVNEPDQDVEESYAEIGESNEIVSEIINKKVLKDPPLKTQKYANKRIKEEDKIMKLNESDQEVEESYTEIGERNEIVSDIINEKVINYPPIKIQKYKNKRIKEEVTIVKVNEPEPEDVEESYAEIGERHEIVSETVNKKVVNYSPIKTTKYTNKQIKEEDTIVNEPELDVEESYAEIGERHEIVSETVNKKVVNYSPIKTKPDVKEVEETIANLNESEQEDDESFAEIDESDEIIKDINEKVINEQPPMVGDDVKCSLDDDCAKEEDFMNSYEHVDCEVEEDHTKKDDDKKQAIHPGKARKEPKKLKKLVDNSDKCSVHKEGDTACTERITVDNSKNESPEHIGEESFDNVMLSQQPRKRVTEKFASDDDDDEEFMIVSPELIFPKQINDVEGGSALKTMPLSDLKIISEESTFSEENNDVNQMTRNDVKDLLQKFDQDNGKNTQILVREMRQSNETLVKHFQEAMTNACKEINVSVKGMNETKTEPTGSVGLLHEQIMKDNHEMKNMIAGLINCSCNENLKYNRTRKCIIEKKPDMNNLLGPEESNSDDKVVIDNETRNMITSNEDNRNQYEEPNTEYYTDSHPNVKTGRTHKEVICIIEKTNSDDKSNKVDSMEDIVEVSEIEYSPSDSHDFVDIPSDNVKVITHTERLKRRYGKKKETNPAEDNKPNTSDLTTVSDMEMNNREEKVNIWEEENNNLKEGIESPNNIINTRNNDKVDSPKRDTKQPVKSNAGSPGLPKKTINLVSDTGKQVGPKLKETLDANLSKVAAISDEKVRRASELKLKVKDITPIIEEKARGVKETEESVERKVKETINTEKANAKAMLDKKARDVKEQTDAVKSTLKDTTNSEVANATTIADDKLRSAKEKGQEATAKLTETLNDDKLNPMKMLDTQKAKNALTDISKDGINNLTPDEKEEIIETPESLRNPNIEEDNWKAGMDNMKKKLKNDYFNF